MSLIEVVVALAILATVLVSLTGVMWQMGRNTHLAGIAAYRTAALESGAALAHSIPWDSLANVVGCTNDSSATLTYTRCIDVTDVAGGLKQVRVVITPTIGVIQHPETLAVFRNRPLPSNPLHVP